ncbi:GxxExxY protein [Acidianus sp. HS-5]|uniref:GxxExxY protein n=1 Tax=Acidianus sp. HS-5 TaxID=2886040 RepID=UPI001F313492|nr:GxxExxY protein [Acidianus sp. HS-5]BDC17410.1 hypothetical protein HS5_03000 [Acidianus sp. HS-5]
MGRKSVVIYTNFSGPDLENCGRLLFYLNTMSLLISSDFNYKGVNYLNPALAMRIGNKRADLAILDSDLNLRLLLEFKELEPGEEEKLDKALNQVIDYSRTANPAFYGVVAIKTSEKHYRYVISDVNDEGYDISFCPSYKILIHLYDSECLSKDNPTLCDPVYFEEKEVSGIFLNELENEVKGIFDVISGKVRGKVRSYVRNEAFHQYELARVLTEYRIKVYPEYTIRLRDTKARTIRNIIIPAKVDLMLRVKNNAIPIEVKSYEGLAQEQLDQLIKYMKLLESPLGIVNTELIPSKLQSPLGVAANPKGDFIRLTVIDGSGNIRGVFNIPFVKKGENIRYLTKNKELDRFIEFIRKI